MSIKIIPAILPKRYYEIQQGVEKVFGSAQTVQIDFVDGHFAHNFTWLFNGKDTERMSAILREDEGLPHWDEVNYELDLMVRDPFVHMDTFMALGPARIIFHIEGLDTEQMQSYFEQLPEIVRTTTNYGMAINVDTDPALITPFAEYVDTIQCMGIANPGFQGQKFDERVIDQIKKVKELYPNKKISVDGGVNFDTAPLLVEAGATRLVVGSVIFQSENPRGTIEELSQLCRHTLHNLAPENLQ